MDIIEAIKSRKSIRGFKPDPVPKEILREMIDIARRSPSAYNAQSWEITVVTGEALDNIKRGNIEMRMSGATPNPDVPFKLNEGRYRERQMKVTARLYELMGIAREDKERRGEWVQKGFRFFDAPAAIILSVDKSLEELHSQFDVGAITQTICLAALSYGLGTCVEDQGIMFPRVVRTFAQIPESKRIAASLAVGYPDWDFPANKHESKREPVENFVTWRGFD